jgi:hypothetical protein
MDVHGKHRERSTHEEIKTRATALGNNYSRKSRRLFPKVYGKADCLGVKTGSNPDVK